MASRISLRSLIMYAAFAAATCARSQTPPAPTDTAPADEPKLPKQPRPPLLSPAESQKCFQLPAGYHLELVLSEPDIREPVLTVFDGNGRMFVAEMRSYMQDVDGTDEKAPISRISLHWSSKNDGVYDRHSVFIDHLVLPRLILPLRDSILVQETDTGDIYEYRDTDGDGVADEKKLFFSGEERKANLEHQTSGLIWSVDNWLYTTYNSYRIRWTPRGVVKEPTAPNGGQWGLTQDSYGKPWIVNAGGELGPINFQEPIVYGAFRIRNELAEGYKEVWPLVPIPDVQGGTSRFRPQEKTLNHITAACGADIYRGDRLPADLVGDLLYCEPVGRLVRRTKIEVRDGLTYLTNAYDKSEFIRSTDAYFRPVNLATAPDGTLYLTDMARGIIQEGNWTKPGSYLRGIIKQYDLDQTIGRGRIWRLVHDGEKPGVAPHLLNETSAQLVAHLADPNGWWRDTAQKLLVLAQDKSAAPALEAMARTHSNPLARLHAIWTLEGLETLTPDLVQEKIRDTDSHVRVAALRASESLFKSGDKSLVADTLKLFTDADPNVAIQAMMTATLLKWPEARPLIQKSAVASPSVGVKQIAAQLLNPLSTQISAEYGGAERTQLEHGQQIFMELCFACHGIDGKGTPLDGKATTLAPPLAGSATVLGHRDAIINVLLLGAAGPIAHHNYDAQMVPMGANDDDWIAAVTSYVRTSFGNKASIITPKDVARVRAACVGRKEPWQLAELEQRVPQPLTDRAAWKFSSNRGKPEAVKIGFTIDPKETRDAWFQVELPEPTTLAAVRLGALKTPRNSPREYKIELSTDGTTWLPPVFRGKSNGPIAEVSFAPTSARFIRITQLAPATGAGWSIDELLLFRAAESPLQASNEKPSPSATQ